MNGAANSVLITVVPQKIDKGLVFFARQDSATVRQAPQGKSLADCQVRERGSFLPWLKARVVRFEVAWILRRWVAGDRVTWVGDVCGLPVWWTMAKGTDCASTVAFSSSRNRQRVAGGPPPHPSAHTFAPSPIRATQFGHVPRQLERFSAIHQVSPSSFELTGGGVPTLCTTCPAMYKRWDSSSFTCPQLSCMVTHCLSRIFGLWPTLAKLTLDSPGHSAQNFAHFSPSASLGVFSLDFGLCLKRLDPRALGLSCETPAVLGSTCTFDARRCRRQQKV